MMVVEVGFFLVAADRDGGLGVVAAARRHAREPADALDAGTGAIVLIALLIVPWRSTIDAPAELKSKEHIDVFAPEFGAQLAASRGRQRPIGAERRAAVPPGLARPRLQDRPQPRQSRHPRLADGEQGPRSGFVGAQPGHRARIPGHAHRISRPARSEDAARHHRADRRRGRRHRGKSRARHLGRRQSRGSPR